MEDKLTLLPLKKIKSFFSYVDNNGINIDNIISIISSNNNNNNNINNNNNN